MVTIFIVYWNLTEWLNTLHCLYIPYIIKHPTQASLLRSCMASMMTLPVLPIPPHSLRTLATSQPDKVKYQLIIKLRTSTACDGEMVGGHIK